MFFYLMVSEVLGAEAERAGMKCDQISNTFTVVANLYICIKVLTVNGMRLDTFAAAFSPPHQRGLAAALKETATNEENT